MNFGDHQKPKTLEMLEVLKQSSNLQVNQRFEALFQYHDRKIFLLYKPSIICDSFWKSGPLLDRFGSIDADRRLPRLKNESRRFVARKYLAIVRPRHLLITSPSPTTRETPQDLACGVVVGHAGRGGDVEGQEICSTNRLGQTESIGCSGLHVKPFSAPQQDDQR